MSAPNSRRQRVRVYRQAARAWQAGYPHQAWETLHNAGMGGTFASFQRVMTERARARYEREIRRHSA